jgi:hypothetical protein
MDAAELWAFLPVGYLFTVLIETPVLALGLAPPHPLSRRLFAGVWLTACTYPIVVLVLPLAIGNDAGNRIAYLMAAETFAPLAECLLFAAAFHFGSPQPIATRLRDYGAITVANLASFGLGELLTLMGAR